MAPIPQMKRKNKEKGLCLQSCPFKISCSLPQSHLIEPAQDPVAFYLLPDSFLDCSKQLSPVQETIHFRDAFWQAAQKGCTSLHSIQSFNIISVGFAPSERPTSLHNSPNDMQTQNPSFVLEKCQTSELQHNLLSIRLFKTNKIHKVKIIPQDHRETCSPRFM